MIVGPAVLLTLLLPQPPAPGEPAAALRQAVAAAEASLREGDAQAALARARTALLEGWLLMARLAAAEGRAPAARVALEQAALELEAGPGPEARDLELAFALARERLALGEAPAASALFARIVKERPIAQTHVLIGRAYRDFGVYDRARSELRAALEKDSGVRRAHYYLGTVAVKEKGLGGLEEAIEEFGAELKLAPGDPLASLELGVALVESQRPAEALPPLEAAARSRPPQSRTLAYLGRAQLGLERPAEAVASLQRALELARQQGANEPALLTIHLQLGQALARLGRADEAAVHFAESQRISAAGRVAEREQLARYMADSSDPDGPRPAGPSGIETAALAALPHARIAELQREAETAVARTYLNLGVLQAQREQFARAAELFEQAARLDPDLPQVQSSLGVAYFNARLFDKATGPLARALAAHPDAGLKRMLAMAWLNLQDYRKAAELLGDDPDRETNPSLQFAYGMALVKSDRAAEAEAVFSSLLARHGDSPEVSVMLGQAHAQQGDFDSAVQSLKRALELKPDVAEANATLGVIYLRQGRLTEAEEALRAELRGHPDDLESMHNLAIVLDSEQKPEEAIPLLRQVLEARSDRADARYLLGKILLAQGAATEAAEQLEAAARLAPEDPSIHYQLGQAYQKLGRTELAEQQFEVFRQLKSKR